MGILGLMGFYGVSPARENEKLTNAQKELISNLRSTQNKAIAGANSGLTYNFTYTPPAGITVAGLGTICFYNPNLIPPPCSMTLPMTIVLTNSANGATKSVRIDGSANKVLNIYAL